MARISEKWIDGLQFSSLFWPPPPEAQQRKVQITAYVDYFGQFISERFSEEIAELIRNRYPSNEKHLFDDVLATFVLHHPEHCDAVVLPIISLIIDGTLVYDKDKSPFASFISLFCPDDENEYSEQWALACGEILRILTHYNRPVYKVERQKTADTTRSKEEATTSSSAIADSSNSFSLQTERRPSRPLSPWITDTLLVSPLGIKSDYFRWCGGVMGRYASGELKPPMISTSQGNGKHPKLMPSTPRWAVANGAGVIVSVCDEEVTRYETVTLTAVAVPALLLPPPTTSFDEHLIAGLPALEPYARLFHRYYAIATPSATQRLLLGLLEAPPSWAPDALDAAVQLVELLRAAEDYTSGMRLPKNWMHLHFLRAIGIAMSMREGIAADAAAALLFRILSQPALLFPPLRQVEGFDVQHEPSGGYISCYRKQIELPAAAATIEATAQGVASMLCAHGPEVEWRICTIWEAAYGLIPLNSSAVDLPELIVATPLQPPLLSWNLYIPLLKVLEYLPRGSPSEACLMKIFVATVEAILHRTFPIEACSVENRRLRSSAGPGSVSKNLAVAELRTMVHSLFLEPGATEELASRLLFVVLTACVSHEAHTKGQKRVDDRDSASLSNPSKSKDSKKHRDPTSRKSKKQGPIAAFDSYVLAAVCALACELQLYPLIYGVSNSSSFKDPKDTSKPVKLNGSSCEFQGGMESAMCHTRRILSILEALFLLRPSTIGLSWEYSSNEIVAAAMVAAHVSELFRRSKACMNALSVLMRCKWDNEIHNRASSLYNLIDVHSKAVASIVNKAEPLEAQLSTSQVSRDSPGILRGKKTHECTGPTSTVCFQSEVPSTLASEESSHSKKLLDSGKVYTTEDVESSPCRSIASFQMNASDLANFLTMDRHIGFNCSVQNFIQSVLVVKQELCFSVVSLLWHKLLASPETQPSAESTSAQQGWRQVVDALCNVVSVSPAKAATAVILQAERDLQPWIAKDDDQGQKMWMANQRIVKLLVELMRNYETPESLVILASASDLLLRATDGMLVDGEACTLPQLELLEATARAVQQVSKWGESGLAIADGLSNLLKCRVPATIACLSHPSAHVRARSISVLRDILQNGSITPGLKQENSSSIHGPLQLLHLGITEWQADIEKCLTWEAHSRLARGDVMLYLDIAAKELGCKLTI
ncbi:protein GIGANTEA isoform X2 [Silene latifolia]|uniref:protein GIGANTEA isoform X2 n=2 Tax=Silene latifolia TaxID=37657 RepID=UPI003D7742F1